MIDPTVDIIVPVWNSPVETRACLAAILTHSPQARLIIVASGSSRETELMLEEFSEPLADRALYIISDRNVGLVPAINMGLARSDSDFAIIVRPQVQVAPGWLAGLLEAAGAGIGTPLFSGSGAPLLPPVAKGCTLMETCGVSFLALALKGEMHMLLGGFDEGLDSGEWCLRDYMQRARNRGYRTCVTTRTSLSCQPAPVFGSSERLRGMAGSSERICLQRWGVTRHYCLHFGGNAEAAALAGEMETILEGARQGHRFDLLLHRRQFADFRRLGWNGLHTGIELTRLSILAPQRDLLKKVTALRTEFPEMLLVNGSQDAAWPENSVAIPFAGLVEDFGRNNQRSAAQQQSERRPK